MSTKKGFNMQYGFGETPENILNIECLIKISPSAILEFLKSPAHYHAKYIKGIKKVTKSMQSGSLLHMSILEPDKYYNEYCLEPKIENFDAINILDDWKAIAKELGLPISGRKEDLKQRIFNIKPELKEKDWDYIKSNYLQGRIPINELEWATIQNCKESLEYTPSIKKLFSLSGFREKLMWIYDDKYNILYRFKCDFYTDTGIIVDVKKCKSASERDFSKKIYFENLYVQAAMYYDLLQKLSELDKTIKKPKAFMFLACEMESPHIWQPYTLNAAALDAGEVMYKKAIIRLLECFKENKWPGYSNKIQDITLPHYAWDMINDDEERQLEDG